MADKLRGSFRIQAHDDDSMFKIIYESLEESKPEAVLNVYRQKSSTAADVPLLLERFDSQDEEWFQCTAEKPVPDKAQLRARLSAAQQQLPFAMPGGELVHGCSSSGSQSVAAPWTAPRTPGPAPPSATEAAGASSHGANSTFTPSSSEISGLRAVKSAKFAKSQKQLTIDIFTQFRSKKPAGPAPGSRRASGRPYTLYKTPLSAYDIFWNQQHPPVYQQYHHLATAERNTIVNQRWNTQKLVKQLEEAVQPGSKLLKALQSCRIRKRSFEQREASHNTAIVQLSSKQEAVKQLKLELETSMEQMQVAGDLVGAELMALLYGRLRVVSRSLSRLATAHRSYIESVMMEQLSRNAVQQRKKRQLGQPDVELQAALADTGTDVDAGAQPQQQQSLLAVEVDPFQAVAEADAAAEQQVSLLISMGDSVLASADGRTPLRQLVQNAYTNVVMTQLGTQRPLSALQEPLAVFLVLDLMDVREPAAPPPPAAAAAVVPAGAMATAVCAGNAALNAAAVADAAAVPAGEEGVAAAATVGATAAAAATVEEGHVAPLATAPSAEPVDLTGLVAPGPGAAGSIVGDAAGTSQLQLPGAWPEGLPSDAAQLSEVIAYSCMQSMVLRKAWKMLWTDLATGVGPAVTAAQQV